MKEKFFSTVIEPVTTMDWIINRYFRLDRDRFITDETVKVKLVRDAKRVYVVPFWYGLMLAEYKLKPWVDSPAYLLGLIGQICAERIPKEFNNVHFVAIEPDNPTSVFQNANGERCFLCVFRRDAYYKLGLISVCQEQNIYSVFLAEDA